MIKKLIALGVLAAVLKTSGFLPFQSSDVAELVPVRALVVCKEAENIVLDGGACVGVGKSWQSAWEDLQRSAEGHVFLGTADHVILCGSAMELLPQVLESETLRPAASICVSDEGVNAIKAADYLDAHDGGVNLRQVQILRQREGVVKLPELVQTEGGFRLYGAQDR